jgi:YD repeat-containing protein
VQLLRRWRFDFPRLSDVQSWLSMQYNYDLWHARKRVNLADVEKVKLTVA